MTTRSARRAAVLLAAIVVTPACDHGDDDAYLEVTAYFDAAVGIYPSGDVVVLDHPIGTIETVELEDEFVRVDLRVRSDVPLPADLHAAIEAETVLGERRIVLSPPWSPSLEAAGAERLADGATIPAGRTSAPTEPDEALQAFNELLSNLDPTVVGGLVADGAQILDGRGAQLGQTIDASAALAAVAADVDQPILETAASLNRVAAVLNERDAQLRSLIDGFGNAVGVLADERAQLDALLTSLAGVTAEVDGIITTHATDLPDTLATLTATLQVVAANADTIPVLAGNLPVIAESFEAAYRPEIGGFFLKVNTSEVLSTVLAQLLEAVGLFPGTI